MTLCWKMKNENFEYGPVQVILLSKANFFQDIWSDQITYSENPWQVFLVYYWTGDQQASVGNNWNLQVMFAHVFVILLDYLIIHLNITHWSAHLKVLLRFLGFGCSPKMLNDAALHMDKLKRDHIQQSSDRESLRYKSTFIKSPKNQYKIAIADYNWSRYSTHSSSD